MTTYSEITNQIADQWVAALKNAEQFVGVVSDGAQRLAQSSAVPTLPAPFRELNGVIADKLPEPREIVRTNFDVTGRLLAAQRDFTLKLVDASAVKTASAAAGAATAPAKDKNA